MYLKATLGMGKVAAYIKWVATHHFQTFRGGTHLVSSLTLWAASACFYLKSLRSTPWF